MKIFKKFSLSTQESALTLGDICNRFQHRKL